MVEFRTDTAGQFIGKELYVSDWLTIDQKMVTSFATTTLDPDWLHRGLTTLLSWTLRLLGHRCPLGSKTRAGSR